MLAALSANTLAYAPVAAPVASQTRAAAPSMGFGKAELAGALSTFLQPWHNPPLLAFPLLPVSDRLDVGRLATPQPWRRSRTR